MICIDAEQLQEGLYNIKDGKIYKYKAKGGTVRAHKLEQCVRCSECKWLRYCETEEMELTLDCDHPDGGGIPRSEEWFCADGERKGQV